MPGITRSLAQILNVNADNFRWASPFGGSWGAAANWQDTTAGTVAATSPTAANAVTIAGGSGGNFTNIVGSGSAAGISASGDVLLWGAVAVTGAVSLAAGSELDLDGGASVTATGVALAAGAAFQAMDGSSVKVSGTAALTDAFLLIASGSALQAGSLIANGLGLNTGTVAVDAAASIEIGSTGNVAVGAITIDGGQSATISGTIDGNLTVNGTLAVQAGGTLAIDMADPFGAAQTIAGTGTLLIGEDSEVLLGVADSAAIEFAAPGGTLVASVLPTGTISGFASGDTIALPGLATGLTYTQTSATLATLTLSRGGVAAGALALAGNYAGRLFHIQMNAAGTALITLQTVGAPPQQPAVIAGTAGSDVLIATANNQTLTGWGGNDVLNPGAFTGIDFKDTSANLNASTIIAFGMSDTIDLTDMKPAAAVVTFTPASSSASAPPVPAMLMVTDGTHATTVILSALSSMAPGLWSASTDGSAGSQIKYTGINTDAYTFGPVAGDSAALAANWRDTTTGTAAATVPGVGNAISVTGGTTYTDIGGKGVAASMAASGDVLLVGTLAVGTAIAGISGALTQVGTLALDAAANLHATGTATIAGMLIATGASKFGASSLIGGSGIVAAGGSIVQFGALTAGSAFALATDSVSSIEFGINGRANAGTVTIDSGAVAGPGGTISGNVVVNGTLLAFGQSLAIVPFGSGTASIAGLGTLEIDGGGTLAIGGTDSAAILFGPAGGTLVLGGALPSGTISGFGKGDAIAVRRPVSAVVYAATGPSTGTLTLLNGATPVGTMAFAGSYTGQQFQLLVAANGQSGIVAYAPVPNTAAGTQIGGGTDTYGWVNSSGGAWSNANNWTDLTTGSAPSVGPGAGDPVVIQDNTGPSTQQIVTGSGSAASLQVYGPANTVFTGTIAVTGEFYAAAAAGGDVALASGAHIWAASVYDYTSLTISGGSALTTTGAAGGSTEIVGAMSIVGGSSVRTTGGLDIGGGALGVDATSVFEAGAQGGAASGTFTIDTGQTATIEENGTIAARLIVNGLLIADNATIEGFGGTSGAIGGSGTIAIGAATGPGRLTLRSPDTAALLMNQPGDGLEIQGALPTGAIGGFAGSDTIQLDQTVTGAIFRQTNSTQGVLTLTNGAAMVGAVTLLGNYTGSRFQVDVAAPTGFGTISVMPAASAIASATALTVSRYTSLTGQTTISGTLTISTGSLALAAGARLIANAAMIAGGLQVSGASVAVVTGTATLAGGVLDAFGNSTIQLGALLGSGSGNVLAIDANSIIKIGMPNAVAGALTQAAGSTAVFSGSIYGNVIANGTLAVPGGGTLFIDMTGMAANDPYEAASSIGGSGTLAISQGATLGLGAVDTAAIQFTGPNATLLLAAIPSGTISGFFAGDQIVLDQTVSSVSYTQLTPSAAALTLYNGGAMVGVLSLAGNFAGSLFHIDPAISGASATITLQTLGLAAAQPTLIQGTRLTEALTATANGQTLTGGGGNDTLNGAAYASVDFKDTTANTNFYTIQNFTASDILDLVDMTSRTAWVRYANNVVSVSDGVHAANISLAFTSQPVSGSFHASSDGASGTKLTWG